MKVLIVGQNPSRHNKDKNIPFVGTRSEKILLQWIKKLEIKNYQIVNSFRNVKQKYNKADYEDATLDIYYYNYFYNPDKIITLGKIASKVLKISGKSYFELPHPSGRNRKLNNKKWLEKQLTLAKQYLEVK